MRVDPDPKYKSNREVYLISIILGICILLFLIYFWIVTLKHYNENR